MKEKNLEYHFESISDAVVLQSDLDCLFKWCTVNKLHLNIRKCSILSYGRKDQPFNHVYKINDLVLSRSDSVTDLGIIFETKLDFSQHIDSMVSKAYRRLGILKRKAREFSSESAPEVLFCAHVQSSLEYCSIIWDPNYRNKIEIVEQIQTNFLRYLLYKKNGIYLQDISSSCLRDMFNMSSLCSRRDVSCILFFNKVINGLIDCTDILSSINFIVLARSLRLHKITFCADIQRAFLEVGIVEEYRPFLKFLWIKKKGSNSDLSIHNIETLQYKRFTFGVKCRSFLLTTTIRLHLEKYAKEYEMACEMLKELYVDDLINGASDITVAIQSSTEMIYILSEARKNLRKWATNSPILNETWKHANVDCRETSENSRCTIEDSGIRRPSI
ncbi:hypothetical protein AVEN_241038-1 [Araneus ventricosus]|uniref:Reverse transcriptase domain-containing protein n=1 Tax=Araneus ventricosus TaxID=182803 RepID=A0A4Y2IBG1_ARAVE|nr:hypothetical protein AVEN_241038-1 [Araneus ventricosus]